MGKSQKVQILKWRNCKARGMVKKWSENRVYKEETDSKKHKKKSVEENGAGFYVYNLLILKI